MKKIYNFCFTYNPKPDPKNLQLLKTVPAEAVGNLKEPLYLDNVFNNLEGNDLYYVLRTPEREFTEGDDYFFAPYYEVATETGEVSSPGATLESGGNPQPCFEINIGTSMPLIKIIGSPNSTEGNLDVLTLYGDWVNMKTGAVREDATNVAIKILLPIAVK